MINTWLKNRGLDPEKAVAISVGSDGFVAGKHNLMSVSYCRAPDGIQDSKTVFITGAEPEKVMKYTEVTPAYYSERAVGIGRAIELLEPLEQGEFFVSYSVSRFTRPFLMLNDLAPLLQGKGWFDMISACKARAANQLDAELQKAGDLTELLAGLDKNWTNASMLGYTFDDVCNRAEVMHVGKGMSDLEAKCPRLWALYQAALLAV